MNIDWIRRRTWLWGLAMLAFVLMAFLLVPSHRLHRIAAVLHATHWASAKPRAVAGRPRARAGEGDPLLYRGKVAVLMWHHLDPKERGGDIVTPKLFAAQLDELLARGIHFITLQQFRDFKERGAAVPDNAALITFDDGYESFYKYAYPILQQRGLGGVCFVITGDMRPNAPIYTPHMTPAEITDMVNADSKIEVQAHTDALHYKTDRGHDGLTAYLVVRGARETKADHAARIAQDTERCVNTLRRLNLHPIDTFAYPYGLSDSVAEQVLEQAGIRLAFTVAPGLVDAGTDPMRMPRINGGSPSVSAAGLYAAIVRASRGDSLMDVWISRSRAAAADAIRLAGRSVQEIHKIYAAF